MERLTKTISENGEIFACFPECKDICMHGWTTEEAGCGCEKVTDAIVRLSMIEDILGDDYDLDRLSVMMTQCMSMRDEVQARFRLTAKIPLDRLKELAEADLDGRCVVLPCKVGDVLYSAFPLCGVNKHQIRKFERNSEGDFACSALMIPFSDFGKRVFLTREDAEESLKGERDG